MWSNNRLKWMITSLLLVLLAAPGWAAEKFITVSSTTSTQNSGLFEYLLPKFTAKTGIEVRVIAVGTGQALKLGEKGDADVLLVHDKAGEEKFIREGFGVERLEVMYNDFVVIGPKSDPAGVRGKKDAVETFSVIAKKESTFISRGDDSGTNREELRLWSEAGIDVKAASGKWYKDIGGGMSAALNTAAGLDAYTLSDRATWATFKNHANLELLAEGDPRLFNQYALILVNPARHPSVKKAEGQQFIDWMLSAEGQRIIADYKLEGQTLFHPNAKAK